MRRRLASSEASAARATSRVRSRSLMRRLEHGSSLGARHAEWRERGRHGFVERSCDPPSGLPLLRQNVLDGIDRPRVVDLLRDALQLFVAADLEVLERVRKTRELAGRIGMSLEEGGPVQRAESKRSILQRRRISAQSVEAFLDQL